MSISLRVDVELRDTVVASKRFETASRKRGEHHADPLAR
jgi:hypothetical protein